jgi:hypothetical protein
VVDVAAVAGNAGSTVTSAANAPAITAAKRADFIANS